MQYEELSHYRHELPRPLPRVRNFGWLGKEKDYRRAAVASGVFSTLERLSKSYPVALERGITWCPLCDREVHASEGHLLGISEIWVPDGDAGLYFAAPDLVLHYVRNHSYCPPDEVIAAIDRTNVKHVGPTLDAVRAELIAELFRS